MRPSKVDLVIVLDEPLPRRGNEFTDDRAPAEFALLIARLEARRALVAGEPFALRIRGYSARLIIDEIDFIFATARSAGLEWSTVGDIGSSLIRSMRMTCAI